MGLAPILRKNGFKPYQAFEGETCEQCGYEFTCDQIAYATAGYVSQSGDFSQSQVCNNCRHFEAKQYYGRKHENLWHIWVAIECKMARPRSFNRRERKIIRTKFLSR